VGKCHIPSHKFTSDYKDMVLGGIAPMLPLKYVPISYRYVILTLHITTIYMYNMYAYSKFSIEKQINN
jgi:hypothetical protein